MRAPTHPGAPQPERFLTIDARPHGEERVVLDVAGHVDAFTAPLLRACLRTQLSRAGLRELVIDVGGVEFLDAPGAAAIVVASRRARERGLRFRLRAHGREGVLGPRGLAGALDGLDVEPDVAARLPAAGALAHA